MKKIIGLVFVCCLMAMILSTSAFAADVVASGYCGGEGDGTNMTWELDSTGVLTISGEGRMEEYERKGGENGSALYTTAPWYNYRNNITRVIIENGATSIGKSAFQYCYRLTNINIPNSVTIIGNTAFFDCDAITDITIPQNVSFIGSYALAACDNLNNIIVNSENKYYASIDGVLFSKDIRKLCLYPGGKTASHYFLPDSVTTIEYYAFSKCDNLNSITVSADNLYFSSVEGILLSKDKRTLRVYPGGKTVSNYIFPDSITNIGPFAFADCDEMTYINIPNCVTSIETCAFYGCSNLKGVVIPQSVGLIGNEAFLACPNLTIHGYTGSTAETYAAENDIPFVSIGASTHTYTRFGKLNAYNYTGTITIDGMTYTMSEEYKNSSANVQVMFPTNYLKDYYYIAYNLNGKGEITKAAIMQGTLCKLEGWDAANKIVDTDYSPVVIGGTSALQLGKFTVSDITASSFPSNQIGSWIGDQVRVYCVGEQIFKVIHVVEGTSTVTNCNTNNNIVYLNGTAFTFKEGLTHTVLDAISQKVLYTTYDEVVVDLTRLDKFLNLQVSIGLGSNHTVKYSKGSYNWLGANNKENKITIKITNSVSSDYCGNIEYLKSNSDFDTEITSIDLINQNPPILLVENMDFDTMTHGKDTTLSVGESLVLSVPFAFNPVYTPHNKEQAYIRCSVSAQRNGKQVTSNATSSLTILVNSSETSENTGGSFLDEMIKKVLENVKDSFTVDIDSVVAWNAELRDILNSEQEDVLGYAILSAVTMANAPKETFEDYVTDKVLTKLFGAWKFEAGLFDVEIPIQIRVDTKKYGQLLIQFTYKGSSYTLGSTSYAFLGSINYSIFGGSGLKNVPENKRSGLAGMLSFADASKFAEAAWSLAEAELQSAFNLGYGNDLNDVCDVLFGDTIADIIISVLGYDDYKSAAWEMLTYPAKQMIVKCPVDIWIYDDNKSLVASVQNDVPSIINAENIQVNVYGGEKHITIRGNQQYYFDIVATGEGTMDIVINELSGSNRIMRETTYNDLLLSHKATYSGNIVSELLTQNTVYIENAGKTIEFSEDRFFISEVCEDNSAIKPSSEGLAYTLSTDGTYYILSGIGTCPDTDIVIPATYQGKPVKEIGEKAFYNNKNITSVVIPDNVTKIDTNAFFECSNLKGEFVIPARVISIESNAFWYCSNLTNFKVAEDNPNYCDVDGVLFNKAKTVLMVCPVLKTGKLVIPNGVTRIENGAFNGCNGLTGNLVIPSGVKYIGNGAFRNCSGLTGEVIIPDSVTSMGTGVFHGCSSLMSVVLPSGITKIDHMTFTGCSNLKKVEIPAGINKIGNSVFNNCSSLETIVFEGTKVRWNAIEKGIDWDASTGAYTVETKNVIFISDNGTGNGSAPNNSLGHGLEHETWSVEAYQYNAINLAVAEIAASESKTGTIVVCGPVTIKWGRQAEMDAKGVSDFRIQPEYTAPASMNVFSDVNVTFTSVYNGVDYRATNNAAVIVARTAAQAISLETRVNTTWENIVYRVTHTADRTNNMGNNLFAAFGMKTVIGNGFVTEVLVDGQKIAATPENKLYFPHIGGGSRYNNITADTDLTVLGGTWNGVGGAAIGNSEVSTTYGKLTGNAKLTFGGKAIALGGIHGGTVRCGAGISGDCNTLISGGTIYGSINLGGNGGFLDKDSTAKLTITGGNFDHVDTINDYGVGIVHNPPKYTLLDLSALTVSKGKTSIDLVTYVDEIIPPSRSNVIFIKDGATGDGSSANSALKPTTGNYDPNVSNPARQMDTALYQAWMKLMDLGGGTIVICGPYTLDASTGQGTGTATRDMMVFDRAAHRDDVTITYTSVWDGVDYRQTADAKLIMGATSHLIFPTSTVIENMTIKADATSRSVCAGSHAITLGQGTTFAPTSPEKANDPTAYPILVGGERYKKHEGNPNITIDIGNGVLGHVFGGQNGAGTNYPLIGNTTINIKSGTILGDVGGSSRHNATPIDGISVINIDGGTFKGSINAIGNGGFLGENSTATVKISGGNFNDCLGVFDSAVGVTHNIAKYALLDLSDADKATADKVVEISAGFHKTILPSATASQGLAYTLSTDGTYYILSGIGTCTDTDIVIPSTYLGKPVKEIGEHAFRENKTITSVVIPKSVKTIGNGAFYTCLGLTGNLVIPEGVTTIGNWAFAYCSGLTGNLVIPESVTTIGNYAFYSCRRLTGNLVIPEGVTTIGSSAFWNCYGLTGNLVIPKSVTTIGRFAFVHCRLTNIEVAEGNLSFCDKDGVLFSKDGTKLLQYPAGKTGTYTIPEGVTTIGEEAFSGCFGLTNVEIPSSVTTIGNEAFAYCDDLINVKILSVVTMIGDGAFLGCNSLTSIDVEERNPNYRDEDGILFSKDGTQLLQCPAGKIGFYTIPNGVTTIANNAFAQCTSLTGIKIPLSVTTIGEWTFGSMDLTNVEIPSSVTTISNRAFANCTKLTDAYFYGDVPTSWGSNVFWDTASDFTIHYLEGKSGWTTPTWKASDGSMYNTVVFDDGIIEYGKCGDNLTWMLHKDGTLEISGTGAMWDYAYSFSSVTTAPWGEYQDSLKALKLNKGITYIGKYAFSGCDGFTGNLVIPDSVTTIGKWTFAECDGFTGNLVIPDSVTTIGDAAFYLCDGLTGNLEIPDKVTAIGNWAFAECKGFTGNLVIPDNVTTIGKGAFSYCRGIAYISTTDANLAYSSLNGILYNTDKTTLVCAPGGITGELEIPDSVTTIGDWAFAYCRGITGNVVIGDSVTTIGSYAFYYCDSIMDNLVIGDSVTTIGEEAFAYCNGLTDAYFYGNVPASWGSNVFGNATSNFSIHYMKGKSGWTTPTWTAPDGSVYNTKQIETSKLEGVASGTLSFTEETGGEAYVSGSIPAGITAEGLADKFIGSNLSVTDRSGNTLSADTKLKTGDKIQIKSEDGKTVLDEATVVVTGDATCDGESDILDLLKSLLLMKDNSYEVFERLAVDLNDNGIIDVDDLIALLKSTLS